MDACGVALRVFVLVAAVVMDTDRQTRNIQITLADTLLLLQVPVTAKWSYSSAFVYAGYHSVQRCARILNVCCMNKHVLNLA